MSPIDKITQEALALPKDLKVQLIGQLAESLQPNIEEQANSNQDRQPLMKSQDF